MGHMSNGSNGTKRGLDQIGEGNGYCGFSILNGFGPLYKEDCFVSSD